MDVVDLDKIVAATVITPGSPFGFIHIPEFDSLTDEQRRIIIAEAEALHRQRTFQDDLNRRLEDLTPPPRNDEDILEEARHLDADARQELEERGAPPCYPPNVELPITPDSLCQPQLGAARYFEHVAPHCGAILTSQLRQWKAFIKHQDRVRRPDKKSDFQRSVERIRKRYRCPKTLRRCMLQQDHTKQTILQNWTEYQEFGLSKMEKLEDEKSNLQVKLALEAAERPCAKLVDFYNSLNYSDRKMAALSELLKWIEWEWSRIAGLDQGPNKVHRGSAGKSTSTIAGTHGRYNLRPRTKAKVALAQTDAAIKHQSTRRATRAKSGLGDARTRSGPVSRPLKR